MKLVLVENTDSVIFPENVTVVDSKDIKPCMGCVGCWVKTPGTCVIPDKAQKYGAKLTEFDSVTLISEVCFLGFSYQIKRLLDRGVPYLDVFMMQRGDDIRHKKRYEHAFKVNFVFYGNCTPKQKEEIISLASDICINYFVEDHTVTFVPDLETAVKHSGGEIINYNFKEIKIDTQNFDLLSDDAYKNIVVINASSKGKKSSSEFFSNKLIEILEYQSNTGLYIEKQYWNGSNQIDEDSIIGLLKFDHIIISFGIYVDSSPSHIIENLKIITDYLSQFKQNNPDLCNRLKKIKISSLLNCGLIHGSNNRHSIKELQAFCNENGLSWCQGLGIGAGPLYANPKIDIKSDKNAIEVYNALIELSKNILNYDYTVDYRDILTDGHLPAPEYKNLLNKIWSKALEKNNIHL
ncbi:flavodoxin family protein [Peptostreptococcus faecalis]|uniref:flavodoxin family protein n=1 Tax=Peptostreptococcus faecalis TaxID=2045015 RepID=UPI000C7C81E4|nr:flavodoxin family protein [Peptostreptococcus faecalis]